VAGLHAALAAAGARAAAMADELAAARAEAAVRVPQCTRSRVLTAGDAQAEHAGRRAAEAHAAAAGEQATAARRLAATWQADEKAREPGVLAAGR
jgi:hypothetical protein